MRWTPVRIRDVPRRGTANPAIAVLPHGHQLQSSALVGRVAECGSLGGSYDFVEATPTPTPPGREGQNKRGPLTQGVGSKTRLCPGLISHRPYRTSVWLASLANAETLWLMAHTASFT